MRYLELELTQDMPQKNMATISIASALRQGQGVGQGVIPYLGLYTTDEMPQKNMPIMGIPLQQLPAEGGGGRPGGGGGI